MNNQEICRFVNSKDIRMHLQDINYSFSTAEAAWLINQCHDATLHEKIAAWEKLIDTMPDQPVDSVQFDKPYESIHEVLKSYISLKKDALKMFQEESSSTLYQLLLRYTNYKENYDDSFMYSSYKKCFRQLKKDLSEDDNDDVLYGCIRRSEVNCIYNITAHYNHNGEILDIYIPKAYGILDMELLDFFDLLWFHFPVPFKKGDILYNPHRSNIGSSAGPVVMTGCTPLEYEKNGRHHSDSTDMNVWGYFQDYETGTIFSDIEWNYMDFEYYPEDMQKGKRRIMKALSNYIKEEIPLDLFIKAYHLIMLEETRNDLMPCGWYTDEGMKLAGL